jgi:N-acetylglucosamine-6-phosphate deacetylase
VAAGFIDIQVNGHDDVDVATADHAGWNRLSGLIAAQGVTSWCPTLITAPLDVLDDRIAAVSALAAGSGPAVVGIHLEGPFLGAAHGAHHGVDTSPIDLAWIAALPASVRIMTLGPEREGAAAAIAALGDLGVLVALGHTRASAAEALDAVNEGARLFTHAFNASGPFHHRDPGALGVALADDRIAISLIADGIHVDPMMLRLAWRAKPAGKVVLITDAAAWRSGRLADVGVALVDGAPRLENGVLAGSALTMDAAVRYCVDVVGVDLIDALVAASATPADLLGLDDRGSITPGRRADLIAFRPGLEIAATWVRGDLSFPVGSEAQPAGDG